MIVLLIFFPILVSLFFATMSIAPWLPTKKEDLIRINKIANLKSGQTFIEIGSLNGNVSRFIAKKNPKSHIIGIEKSLFPFLISKIKKNPPNLTFIKTNAFTYTFDNADAIYLFGTDKTCATIIPQKLIPKLKKNTKIISYAFQIPHPKLKHTLHKESPQNISIHEYVKII